MNTTKQAKQYADVAMDSSTPNNRVPVIFSNADAENDMLHNTCRVTFRDLNIAPVDINAAAISEVLEAGKVPAYIAQQAMDEMMDFIEQAMLAQAIASRIVNK